MNNIMVHPLPPGCRLTAVFDVRLKSSHSKYSGTGLDLPYSYHSDGSLKGLSRIYSRQLRNRSSAADVISFSWCNNSLDTAAMLEGGLPVGTMTDAFVKSMLGRLSYLELLHSLRKILQERYSQVPQLSSSHHIDTNVMSII
ncbi:hypothetical protein PHLGIDRAFT_162088 [Phlebiopsis gigantea 11061_1 CR5-6]|uniref:Uncharacterized protein n=1 Tax=Phlebiopsis gigantea (strain 11061_1 CR5-6) TaxID=745531 RepID=A0A0C3S4W8_PHLG1|nr:hypothetical protein PHLGIDRAFT_162088 [Phlebiopsis gigantea 11061_1 CR5-6]